MGSTRASGVRRFAISTLACVVLAGGLGVATAAAQIQGIERGGGVDRPYVPPRKRINVRIGTAPRPRTPKPVAGTPGVPKSTTDAASITISSEAAKHYEVGRSAYDRSDYEGAVKEFEAAIRIESRYVDALIDLGDAYFNLLDLDDSVEAYQRALVIDRNNVDAQFRLGRVSYARKDYDTALKVYNDAIKVRPDDAEAIYNLALTNKALKRYDAAIPYFEKAIDARKSAFPEARINLARCYYEQGKLDESEAMARKALEETGPTAEESAPAWYSLATVLTKKNDLRGATDALSSAISVCQTCPGDAISGYFLAIAQVYEARGLRPQAADSYEKFLQLAPFVPDYRKQEIRDRVSNLRKTD